MKKFLALILLSASIGAQADDKILVCKIFPAAFKAPKDFSGIEMMVTIQNNGTEIKTGSGNQVTPLTTTDTSYEWQHKTVVQGKETVMKESINRVTGSYAMVFFVEGDGRQISKGECVKGEPKL